MKSIPELNDRIDSFACVISALIASDESVSAKERSHFIEFFEREFGLDTASAKSLMASGRSDADKFDEHLAALKQALSDNKKESARFMHFLNTCIVCDGVDDREYEIFDKIKSELF